MKCTTFLKFGLFNIVKPRSSTVGTFLPLYQSAIFKNQTELSQNFSDQQATLRYKQFLPTNLLNYLGFYQAKYLCTKLQFNPQNQAFRIVTLRPRGFHTQQFDVNNILPWSYRDMMAMSKYPEPILPPFLDDQMIYMNKLLRQVYIFESDGVWNQQNIAHPKLSVSARFNEREWFDRWPMF